MTREAVKLFRNEIIAFLDGFEIEYRCHTDNKWLPTDAPYWDPRLDYRIKPKPEYIPFTKNTIVPFRDKWVISKNSGNLYKIVIIGNNAVDIGDIINVSYNELLERYIFDDGSPCGIKI